ncbi:MAG: hypothetical protein JWO58_600 [Chitinophagaceae bacterium]|nr:hypothetical protein [Chitinophagaceae bacterium]
MSRYVPNLIPEQHRILKTYFKGNIYNSKSNELYTVASWMIGVVAFVTALVWIGYPLLCFLFAVLGYGIIPPGQKFLERTLRFRMTNKIKGVFAIIVLIFSFPLSSYYGKIDAQIALQETHAKILAEQKQKHKTDSLEEVRRQNQDSLEFHIANSKTLEAKHEFEEATKQLSAAYNFANTQEDKSRIEQEQLVVLTTKVSQLVSSGKYNLAIPELTDLLQRDEKNNDLLYQRALCYSKTGNIQEAVNDCKSAIDLGSDKAEKLHNKINPVKRRIVDYVTRCCDGTTSSAKGRGACSHHHGVCDWYEPVYEESRKY